MPSSRLCSRLCPLLHPRLSPSRRQRQRPGMPLELDDTQLHLHAQPLLAAWGKQGRDYLRLLDEFDDQDAYRALFDAEAMRIDLFDSPLEQAEAASARAVSD